MIIFIDETGDLGFDFTKPGTSSHFVVTALVLSEGNLRRPLEVAVKRTIKNKVNVGKKGKKKPAPELKGSGTSFAVKEYFWRQLQRVPFLLYAVAVNKERVSPKEQRQRERLYGYLAVSGRFKTSHLWARQNQQVNGCGFSVSLVGRFGQTRWARLAGFGFWA